MMKKFFIRVLIVVAPLFVVPIVNYCVDPAGIYNPEVDCQHIIDGLKSGKNVSCKKSNSDDRLYKRMLVEQLKKGNEFDYIIMGTSRCFCVDTATIHSNSILNLSVAAAQVNDIIAFFQILKENKVSYKNIILGLDATMFNVLDNRWKTNEKYYMTFWGNNEEQWEIRFDKLDNLFSMSYFQTAVKKMIEIGDEFIYTESYSGEYITYHADGSISYPLEYRNRDVSVVDKDATTWMHPTYNGLGIDNKCVSEFYTLVDTLYAEKINIMFFYCPYHPLFYDRIKNRSSIIEGQKVLNEVANRYKIDIIGSYDPSETKSLNCDFYDAAHLKKEVIDRLFDRGLK
ncbi:MAG: hypothetical protein IKP45_08210 [Bacteroidales bacterium]|nr:hypothetical protein [Bacteroidales bacterium]